jgi:hypothetical protein
MPNLTADASISHDVTSRGRSSRMHPGQHANVRYRIDSLVEAAQSERLAAEQRRLHREEHVVHPSIDHSHAANGVRRAVGNALIGIGAAIAGGGDPEARRAA